MTPQKAAKLCCAAGAVVVLGTSLLGQGLGALAFAAWALVPYAVFYALAPMSPDEWPVLGAGVAAVVVEAGLRAAVFVWPRGSTAALTLLFSPVYIGVMVMPAGSAAGFLFGKLWKTGKPAPRGAAALAGAAALYFAFLGHALPELMPGPRADRAKTLAALGEPRVVQGGERFQAAGVAAASAWYVAAPDGSVAVIDRDLALLDAEDFSVRERVPFTGEGRQKWSWFSQLVKTGDGWGILQQGGGFSDTGLLDLSGAWRWTYRPEKSLPPNSLLGGDLDGDGKTEFYAASQEKLARLDERGQEVWTRKASSLQLSALHEKDAGGPAWIVSQGYQKPVRVLDENGEPVGELPLKDEWPLAAVDLPNGRGLLLQAGAVRVLALSGKPLLELPLENLRVTQGLSLRFNPGGTPVLAVAAAPKVKGVERWKILLIENGAVVYDETVGKYPRLFAAKRKDGGQTLMIADAGGLRALRPR